MKRGKISSILRSLGLIYFTDWLRYYAQRYGNRKVNADFKAKNPSVKLPPDYLIYESFQLDYHKYYNEGRDTAKWLLDHFSKHIDLQNIKVLDWGCGPGRIIRHMPELLGKGSECYATDYNQNSIAWCSQNLQHIQFNQNTLEAKLPYADDTFNAIYGISIFTHLAERSHYEWYNELYRVMKPGGIMFLTAHGDNFRVKLTPSELRNYDNGNLIVRGQVKEGHRTFTAFHPQPFMHKLFSNVEVLEHIERTSDSKNYLPQDIWIIRK